MSNVPRSADMLVNLILTRDGVLDKIKKGSGDIPEKTLRALAKETTKELIPPVMKREVGLYYIVVGSLGLIDVAAVIGALYLSATVSPGETLQIPDIVTALGSAAIGALAGILAPTPKEQ